MPVSPETTYPRAIIFSLKAERRRECAVISKAPKKIPRKTDCVRSIDTVDFSPVSIPGRAKKLSLIILPRYK
jgi:dihydropteroate synthase